MTRLKRLIRRCSAAPSFWVLVFVIALFIASNHPVFQSTSGSSANADERPTLKEMSEDKSLIREGTSLTEARGRFKVVNERFVFMDESTGKPLTCLENLMLQRIHSFLKDDEGGRQRWSVSGKITEFNGENFVWLDRAIRAQ
jgi:hypothetical protein